MIRYGTKPPKIEAATFSGGATFSRVISNGRRSVAGNARAAAYLQVPHVDGAGELTVFCASMVGAGLGFLWYNSYPAEIFMGDVGSLALGGGLGIVGTIVLMIVAPMAAMLVQMAISRAREYDADVEAASLTGDPMGLASALRRLEQYNGRFWEDLFPPGRRIPYPSMLRSHPSTEDRVERLIALSNQPTAFPPVVVVETPMISLAGFGPASMRPRYRFPGLWF